MMVPALIATILLTPNLPSAAEGKDQVSMDDGERVLAQYGVRRARSTVMSSWGVIVIAFPVPTVVRSTEDLALTT